MANGHTYTYGDATWKDLLTAFDGNSISYDAIGNPTSYYNGTRWTMGWTNGRSLATASKSGTSLSFAYDANGLRTSKTVNGTTYRYYYAGGKLMRMSWGANIVDFFYDESGLPYAMKYNGTVYYYITNLQGDVMRIVDGSQNIVTSYDYDPYGKVISATGTLANINPLRYRGYVYDTETGFYYLQSRYYDPAVGRFLNADSYATTGQGIIGHNMFAYCGNNPAGFVDNGGQLAVTAGTLIVVTASKVIELALLTGGLALAGYLGYTIGKTSTGASLFPEEEIKEQIEHSLATGKSTTYRKETERHHIVAHRAVKAAPAARILNEVLKDGVESELNLVDLSTKVHRRLHTNLYYNFVNLAIVGAYNAGNGDPAQQERNVRNTLGAIKVMLQAIDAVFS